MRYEAGVMGSAPRWVCTCGMWAYGAVSMPGRPSGNNRLEAEQSHVVHISWHGQPPPVPLTAFGGPVGAGLLPGLVQEVVPVDRQEVRDQTAALEWLMSGSPLYRGQDRARTHLCVCAVVLYSPEGHPVDEWMVLLVDHRRADLWMPVGGHVEPYEDPRAAVAREARSTLGLEEVVWHPGYGAPEMISMASTGGRDLHVDVTLWYVLAGDPDMRLVVDDGEVRGASWWSLGDDISAGLELGRVHPAMPRLIQHLRRDVTESAVPVPPISDETGVQPHPPGDVVPGGWMEPHTEETA